MDNKSDEMGVSLSRLCICNLILTMREQGSKPMKRALHDEAEQVARHSSFCLLTGAHEPATGHDAHQYIPLKFCWTRFEIAGSEWHVRRIY